MKFLIEPYIIPLCVTNFVLYNFVQIMFLRIFFLLLLENIEYQWTGSLNNESLEQF